MKAVSSFDESHKIMNDNIIASVSNESDIQKLNSIGQLSDNKGKLIKCLILFSVYARH